MIANEFGDFVKTEIGHFQQFMRKNGFIRFDPKSSEYGKMFYVYDLNSELYFSNYPQFTNWLPDEPQDKKCVQMASRKANRLKY